MTRGVCPDALAAEVYTLTLVRTHRRCRTKSPHQQTIPDVVGEAFVRWLASPSDKAMHEAGEHAHFVGLNALRYLTHRHTGATPIAEGIVEARSAPAEAAHREAILRTMRDETSTPGDAEEDVIERIDAMRLYRKRGVGRPASTMAEALAVLADRGWSAKQVAAGVGVSEAAVLHWQKGVRRPTDASIAAVTRLAAADGWPPEVRK